MKIIANRYEVLKTRAGGMGVVYLCLDLQEDRPVALKTFRPEYLSDRAARDRFLREGTIWIELGRHPHIVRAHRVEYGGHGLEVYLILEWVAEAEDKRDAALRQWLISGQPLPIEQALLFALHITRGMRHATATRPDLIHRDLKPENVLVGREGLAKVTDFGLVKILAEVDEAASAIAGNFHVGRLTQPGHTPGTPQYMAPEQWRRQALDARADIYAFGCILYEMVTGQMAVTGHNLREIKEAHLHGRVADLARPLLGEVGRVVQRCVATHRDGRYHNWEAVEAAVMQAYQAEFGRPAPAAPKAEAETHAERVTTGYSYHALGLSYFDITKYDKAVVCFERAIQIGRVEHEQRLGGAALCSLGTGYNAMGMSSRAIGCYEQALIIAREIGDLYLEGVVLCCLGISYKDQRKPKQVIGCYEQALAIAREIGDRGGEGAALSNLGVTYTDLGEPSRAIGCYEQALAIAREIGDRGGEGKTLGNLGIAYRDLGEPCMAISFHEQCLAIARDLGDRAGEGRALGSLGNAYLDLGEPHKALSFFEGDLTITRELGDRMGEGAALGNLGTAYGYLGEPHKALSFYEQHLAIAQQFGDRAGEGRALRGLGLAYRMLGQSHKALSFLEQCFAIAQELEDQMGAAIASLTLALSLSDQGQVAEALRYAEQAAQLFTQVGHPRYAKKAQQLLARLQGHAG